VHTLRVTDADPGTAAPHPAPAISETALHVQALADADPDVAAFGERYWALAKIDRSVVPPKARWEETTKDLAVASDFPAGRMYVLAAAGVRATVDGRMCFKCDRPLSLRSRIHLDGLLAGDIPDQCADCDDALATAVSREVSPAAQQRRRAAQEQTRRRQQFDAIRRAWRAAQQSCIDSRCPVDFAEDPDWLDLDTPIEAELTALAMLRHAPATAPIPAVGTWPRPLAPGVELGASLLSACQQHKLIRIHPSSPIDAFDWAMSFEEAVAAATDPADIAPPEWDEFYLFQVAWYAPFGTSLGTSGERLARDLILRLSPSGLRGQRTVDFLSLLVEVLARETVRYFEHQIAVHNLPPVPDNHAVRLLEAARRLAEVRTLAESYNVAWRAARTAAANAQQHLRAPKINMTTHAVNLFEQSAQQYTADPATYLKPYRPLSELPAAALTRTMFITLLNTDLMSTSRASAEQILAEAGALTTAPDDTAVEYLQFMRVVLGTQADGDPHAVYAVLVQASASDDPVLATASDQLVQLVERLRTVGYTLGGALAGAVGACALLDTPLRVPVDGGQGWPQELPVGVLLAEWMHSAAGGR